MTAKRFGMIKTNTYELYVPVDEKKVYIFPSFEDELDCMSFVNALNDLEEKHIENGKIASHLLKENEHIKHTIKTMMENERTELGKSVLKQLYEAIQ